MPPWADSAEEVGALLAGLLGALAVIVVALLGAVGAVWAAWRSKVKPYLSSTSKAAGIAAEQLTRNSGSSARDSLDRLERNIGRLSDDLRLDRAQTGRRLERLESFHSAPSAHSPIQENTEP